MAKFSEVNFNAWCKPASDNEESKLELARTLVKRALIKSNELSKYNYEVFGQGSYANDTNVRLNSDIDMNVMYKGEAFYSLPVGKTEADYYIQLSNILSFGEYKNMVEEALVNEFGRIFVKRENKCIRVLGNDKRIECDVVPTFAYHRYEENGIIEGIRFITDKSEIVNGFPKQHTANAIEKNKLTERKFKRATRIFKRLRYKLKDDRIDFPNTITSFLIESLIWNVPNKIYNEANSWSTIVRECIVFLYNETKDPEKCRQWGEVSELLYLFNLQRRWSVKDVNDYLLVLWQYLELQ